MKNAPKWHPEISLYNVINDKNDIIGHFYLDLHPREGKYSHAACFPVFIAYSDQNGNKIRATSCMVCNFTGPKDGKPSLLRFDEVKTFFHEFGHVMHSICASSKYYRLNWNWLILEQDFLEVPSMMFENWIYYPEILRYISGHYKNKEEKIPEDMRQKIVDAKNVGFYLNHRRLIFMSIFDILIHSSKSQCTEQEFYDLYRNIQSEYTIAPELDTTPYSSWQHMTSGYNAGYYGYMWSEVLSFDLFHEFKTGGLLNPEIGKKLRQSILEPCAILTANEMFNKFLGRDAKYDAFLEEYGLI